MPQALSIDWGETEKACLAGVPVNQVAKAMAERAGLPVKRVYDAIRQRISRERWPLPDSIMRRARAQARLAAGLATNAKEAAAWNAGKSGAVVVQESREAAGVAVVALEEFEKPLSLCEDVALAAGAGQAEGAAGVVAGGAFTPVPITAAELVTTSLAERGQSGLSLALDAALAALRNLDPSAPLPVRNAQDLLTMVKATKEAAGLDRPGVAVAISLNSSGNATIAGWADADIVDTIG
jgi:hypothetical protein